AVAGHRRELSSGQQIAVSAHDFCLAGMVELKCWPVGMEDDLAGFAVHDDGSVIAQPAHHSHQASHRWDVERAGDDGRVRGAAAALDGETDYSLAAHPDA